MEETTVTKFDIISELSVWDWEKQEISQLKQVNFGTCMNLGSHKHEAELEPTQQWSFVSSELRTDQAIEFSILNSMIDLISIF
jgi:hypothetical protein